MTVLLPGSEASTVEVRVADYYAIEARVIAWLAGETSPLQAFRDGKDLYCETRSRMFGVPVEKHGINAELRQKGKIATLACGYNGSVGALKAMGALRMGLAEHELKPIVDACQLMTTPPDWAAGLPLDAVGYECDYYRKD